MDSAELFCFYKSELTPNMVKGAADNGLPFYIQSKTAYAYMG